MRTYRPLQSRSVKAQERDAEYQKVRREVMRRDHYTCQAGITGVCLTRATDCHHLRKKSMASKSERDTPENLIAICRRCHDWIEANTEKAWELGLYRSPKMEARR